MNVEEQKQEVLKFAGDLRNAGVAKVWVSYHGSGDEGFAEAARFEDTSGNWIDGSALSGKLDSDKLSDLLEEFAPEGYQDNEGGHGIITFDVEKGKIRIEHSWYETVSHETDPQEI